MNSHRLLALALTLAALSACGGTHRRSTQTVYVQGPTPVSHVHRSPWRPPEPTSQVRPEPVTEAPVCETPPQPVPERSDPFPAPPTPTRPVPTLFGPKRDHPVFDEHPGQGYGVTGNPKPEHPVLAEHPGRARGRAGREKIVLIRGPEGEEHAIVVHEPSEEKLEESVPGDGADATETESKSPPQAKGSSKGKAKDKAKAKDKGKDKGKDRGKAKD